MESLRLKLQVPTCSGTCTLGLDNSLFFLIKAIIARIITNKLSETVIEIKLIPIGDNPKNKPTIPVKPKLNATDNTNCSTKSMLFFPKNNMFTRQ